MIDALGAALWWLGVHGAAFGIALFVIGIAALSYRDERDLR